MGQSVIFLPRQVLYPELEGEVEIRDLFVDPWTGK
jgi:hypothetical protein